MSMGTQMYDDKRKLIFWQQEETECCTHYMYVYIML